MSIPLSRLSHTSRNAARRGLRTLHSLSGAPIDVSPEVQDALQNGGPVVALETALVTHGLPYPINLQTALSLESKARSVGAIPATIGLLDGRIKVGLTGAQLDRLAEGKANPGLVKVSRRDLAAAVGLGLSGGTTISGTSVIANILGIKVFPTGGLGGVHRGGEITWDVSADLTELGRTPIAVVSGGVKSILDIPRTLEYLVGLWNGSYLRQHSGIRRKPKESPSSRMARPIISLDFLDQYQAPRAHGKSTLLKLLLKSYARILDLAASPKFDITPCPDAGKQLGLQSGMLFAAPIPEEYAKMASFIQDNVDRAIKESEENGMNKSGKEITPWLLDRVAQLTEGKSITNNVALLENTAIIGGKIAVEYAKLSQGENGTQETTYAAPVGLLEKNSKDNFSNSSVSRDLLPSASLLVIGAAAMDITSQPDKLLSTNTTLAPQSTTPGQVSFASGGVARNIAEAAHRILSSSTEPRPDAVLLVSPLGNDLFAKLIQEDAHKAGMRADGFIKPTNSHERSAVCNLQLDSTGNLVTGIADMSITSSLDAQPILEVIEKQQPRMVAFDGNLNPDTLISLLGFCAKYHIPTFFEPTSVMKSTSVLPAIQRLVESSHFHSAPVTFASPNILELSHTFREIQSSPHELMSSPQWWSAIDSLRLGEEYRSDLALLSRQTISSSSTETLSFLANGLAQMAVSLLPFFQHLFIKCGEKGVVVAMRLTGESALSSGWVHERTRPNQHQIIAKGRDSILVLKHYPVTPIDPSHIVNVTGAGDSFVGTLLAGLIQEGALDDPGSMDKLVERAQRASVLSLRSADAVSSLLTDSKVNSEMIQ